MSELTPERRKEIERDTGATIGYTSATSAEPSWTMLENSPSGHKWKLAAHIRFLLHALAAAEQTTTRLTAERDEWKRLHEVEVKNAFLAGILAALAVVSDAGADTICDEIISIAGLEDLIRVARERGSMRWSGMSRYLRKERANGRS